MQLELVDSWGERSRGERSSFPHSSHQIVCPRMSVGYAEVLPFRPVPSSWDLSSNGDNIKRDNKDKPQLIEPRCWG